MLRDSRGNVALEFVGICVFLLIPICYLAISTISVAQTFLTLTSAARTGARAYVTQDTDNSARARSMQIMVSQLKVGHVDPAQVKIQISCFRVPCLTPGNFVTATLKDNQYVEIPFLRTIRIPISVRQTIEVDAVR